MGHKTPFKDAFLPEVQGIAGELLGEFHEESELVVISPFV